MSQVGSVYAQGLYSLAKDEGLDGQILGELMVLKESFAAEPDFLRLLASPNLSKDERCEIIHKSLSGKVHTYVVNFLKILTEKDCIRHFPECAKAYRRQYNEDHGILPVKAITAVALTQQQIQRLKDKLEGITGNTVEIINQIDPACLGGVRLDFGGKQLDGTVKTRLESIGGMLKNTVL